jgi:hypothetical protein
MLNSLLYRLSKKLFWRRIANALPYDFKSNLILLLAGDDSYVINAGLDKKTGFIDPLWDNPTGSRILTAGQSEPPPGFYRPRSTLKWHRPEKVDLS